MPRDPFPTVLNEYKYVLTRRRLLQTLTGGVKVQVLPISVHILQWLLWIFPLAVSVPFIATGDLWNTYYIGLTYSTLCGFGTLLVGCIVKILFRKLRRNSLANNTSDEEQDIIILPSILSITALSLVFPRKNCIDIVIHAISSGLTCYSAVTLLNVYVMVDIISLPSTVFVFIIGTITLCTAHYSLIANPPHEISIYRQHHQDRLHLFYLRRCVYVILIGTIFTLIKNILDSSYLIIPYIVHSMLPLLWTFSLLPPLDALIFWIIEQSLIHLMGGSAASSELRLLIQSLLALLSTIGLIWIKDQFVLILIATALGFLLSQNIIDWMFRVLISLAGFIHKRFLSQSHPIWYSSYYIVDFRPVKTLIKTVINIIIYSFKSVALLILSIVISSQTVSLDINNSSRERVTTALSCTVVVLYVLIKTTRSFAGAFLCFGLVRNPCHPRNIQSANTYNCRKSALLYVSIPSQILTLYVAPFVMIGYVSLFLHEKRVSSDLHVHVWFTITTVRLFRKIWQNSLSCLTDLTIIAILFFSLPSESSWWTLEIGTQALAISFAICFTTNILQRLKFFILMLISFITNCSNNSVFYSSLALSMLLIPFSLLSILLSALFSSPIIPCFTFPILIMTFPRPQSLWPSFFDPKSFSQTYESSYYKQALPAISKSISQGFRTGISDASNPGAIFLIRFQDRLSIIKVVERGYSYCLILVRGLELQETSCHATEALLIDEIFENFYSNKGQNSCICTSWFNTYPFHHLQLTDSSIGRVYSDARNSMSGIINRPDSLEKFSENLYKMLVWVFANHVAKNNGNIGISNDKIGEGTDSASISSIISPSHVTYWSAKVHPASATTELPTTFPFTITELSKVANNFPNEWFEHVIKETVTTVDDLKSLITACYILTDVPASNTIFKMSLSSQTQPEHIYNGFCGEYYTPMGMHANKCKNWMKKYPLVKKLTNKAYRYAVKLLYDETAFGEVTSDTELVEKIQDYDMNWYIGPERNTEDWERNIIKETHSLFSIGSNESGYTAHLLTLQDEVLYTGLLNQSLVEGIWSNLSFELQYLTNDDEERYSIQAQPRLLRNLITQGAELPYGYQIYSSDLITIPSI